MTTCPHCNIEFTTNNKKMKYCCAEHRIKYNNAQQISAVAIAQEKFVQEQAYKSAGENYLYDLRMAEAMKGYEPGNVNNSLYKLDGA